MSMKAYETIFDTLNSYGALHDGLSDMIEGGRLNEGDIPDDYQWLVRSLSDMAGKIEASLKALTKLEPASEGK